MVITIEEAKQHLRVDGDEENSYIEGLIKASEKFIKNGTGKTFDNTNFLAKTVCLMLVADMYENRVTTTDKVGTKTRELVSMMLIQLGYDDEGVIE
jgi:uncharacterized phage protein (predicted DNA packaging)